MIAGISFSIAFLANKVLFDGHHHVHLPEDLPVKNAEELKPLKLTKLTKDPPQTDVLEVIFIDSEVI